MKRYIAFIISIGIVFLVCGQAVFANESSEPEPTRVFQLNEVVVRIEDLDREVDMPNMDVIKPDLFPMGIGTTVDTALERQPGVDVQRIQEVGAAIDDDSIKIRGFGARRILVTRDGRPLNTSGVAGGYFIDWTMIPLNNVERVEIIKGVGDPRYSNTLGGVVNLVRRRLPQEAPFTEVQFSSGSYKTNILNIFHGWTPSALEYSISMGFSSSDGYLKNGNTDFGNIDLYLGYKLTPLNKLILDISYSNSKKGFIVPNRKSNIYGDPLYDIPEDPHYPASDGEFMYGGMGGMPAPGSWWEKKKWMADLGFEHNFCDYGSMSLWLWANYGDRESYNLRRVEENAKAEEVIYNKDFYDDRSYGASGSLEYTFISHTLRFGTDVSHLRDDGDEILSRDSRFWDQSYTGRVRNKYYVASKNFNAYIMDDLIVGENLILTPGVKYIYYKGISGPSGKEEKIPDISMHGISPSLKFTYTKGSGNIFYLSAARALRMPTPPEYYWHYTIYEDSDGDGMSDDAIRQKMRYQPFDKEDGVLVQAGWSGNLPYDTTLKISPYYYRIKNYLQFDLVNFISYNIKRVTLYGFEFEITKKFSPSLSVFANYTLQNSRTEGDPYQKLLLCTCGRDFDELPGLPGHKGNFGIQFKGMKNQRVAVFIKAVSDQDVIYNNYNLNANLMRESILNLRRQSGYAVMDVEGHYPLLENMELAFFGRNLFNKDYQERFGFPASGRTFGLSLKTTF